VEGLVLGVVGGGTMGSGIAVAGLAAKGVAHVVLVDQSDEGLEKAKAYITRGVQSLLRRNKMPKHLAKPAEVRE